MNTNLAVKEVGRTPEELGGEYASSYVPHDYEGECTVKANGKNDRSEEWTTLNTEVAERIASLAIKPDIGGYHDVSIIATPGVEVEFHSPNDWLFN